MAIDWTKAKLMYVTGNTTLRDVAANMNISERSVFRRASKENWKAEKEKYVSRVEEKCQQKSAEKSAEKFSDYAAELQSDVIRISRALVEKIDLTLSVNLPFAPKDLKSMSSMLLDLMTNLEKMQAGQKDDGEKVTVEFVNMEWDDDAED